MKVLIRDTILIQTHLIKEFIQGIPYEGIQNSKTGGAPKDLLHQIGDIVGGAITSVTDFIHRGLVALANLIEHAAEVVAESYKTLLNTLCRRVWHNGFFLTVFDKLFQAFNGKFYDMYCIILMYADRL